MKSLTLTYAVVMIFTSALTSWAICGPPTNAAMVPNSQTGTCVSANTCGQAVATAGYCDGVAGSGACQTFNNTDFQLTNYTSDANTPCTGPGVGKCDFSSSGTSITDAENAVGNCGG